MDFLDLTLSTPESNLALDEALLLEAEASGGTDGVLRLWEWPRPAVVLGSGGRFSEDVHEQACVSDGVPVFRRSSGGGTVLLGRGCLLFSVILPYRLDPLLNEIASSYRYILGRVLATVRPILPDAEQAGTSDLASGGLKFSGNAQQRKRVHLLHHGTLLYDFDLPQISRYLRMPERRPDYRADRSHEEFVRNLPVSGDGLRRMLREVWDARTPRVDWPEGRVNELVSAKYGRPEWVRRR